MGSKRKRKRKRSCNPRKKLKGGGWSELPTDLLSLILERLFLPDYLRFGYVCKSWRSIAIQKPPLAPAPQPPWLMLQEFSVCWGQYTLCSLLEGKRDYKLRLSESGGRLCCGCSEGWFVMVHFRSLNICLLNPFSKAEIQLPNQATMLPRVEEHRKEEQRYINQVEYIKKTIVFSVGLPDNCDNSTTLMIVAICGTSRYLSFCKLGDKTWTSLEEDQEDLRFPKYDDIIFHNGKLYASTIGTDTIHGYSLDGACPKLMDRIGLPTIPWRGGLKQLVESRGDLLMVLRHYSSGLTTVKFEVLKLELHDSVGRWSKMETLGNQVLFSSTSGTLSVSADDFPSTRGSCIYFIGKYNDDFDMGVFSLQDGIIRTSKFHIRYMKWHPIIWLLPKLL